MNRVPDQGSENVTMIWWKELKSLRQKTRLHALCNLQTEHEAWRNIQVNQDCNVLWYI